MALSIIGKIEGAEVRVINHAANCVLVTLDSGEDARLPFCKLKGDRQARFDSLREGDEFKVLVIATNEGRTGKPFHTVSEHLDEVIEGIEDCTPAPSAKPDPALVVKFPVGKSVKGQWHLEGSNVIVLLDGHRARLPLSEMNGLKTSSLRKGVPVSAKVMCVDGSGVLLSRKAVG
jgi:hypothetical protein